MKAKRRYVYYDNLATVHIEIGYLIFLFLVIMAYDFTKACIILGQPVEDSYIVPGVKTVQEIQVEWNHPYGSDEAIEKMQFTPVVDLPKSSTAAALAPDAAPAPHTPQSATAAAVKETK